MTADKNTQSPWVFEPSETAKQYAPATLRNRDAIAAVLRDVLPPQGRVLEIASGTGEHICHFASIFRHLYWQPSDPDPAAIASITAWRNNMGLPNIAAPVLLDATAGDWPVGAADAILCINMVHIAPWAATIGLMAGAGQLLPPGGMLYLYGPYVAANVETAPSNLEFDRSLKGRNPEWGLRDMADVVKAATASGLVLDVRIAMPANNLSLVFRKA